MRTSIIFMSSEVPEIIWKNDHDGNSHSLVYQNGTLTLTVVKPGNWRWKSDPQPTHSSFEEWKTAFASLGPKWIQISGKEASKPVQGGNDYSDERYAQTQTERVVWNVHHIEDGYRYLIRDALSVQSL